MREEYRDLWGSMGFSDIDEVINFWFVESGPEQWFKKDPSFDSLVAERFESLHSAAMECELHSWRDTPQGRLAEIIILDQFSRNIYRGRKKAFAGDIIALALSQEALHAKAHISMEAQKKAFLYMPFMHSESAAIHEKAVQLFGGSGLERNLTFELRHKAIIDRFGRYPHRNSILGRVSTAEEIKFLKLPGSSF